MEKSLAISLLIGGTLDATFRRAFGQATQSLKDIDSELKTLERNQKNLDLFRSLKTSIRETEKNLKSTKGEMGELLKEMRKTKTPSADLNRQFEKAKSSAQKLTGQLKQQKESLHRLRGELKSSGIDTRKLVTHNQKLRASIQQTRLAQDRLNQALARRQEVRGQQRQLLGQAAETAALVLALRAVLRPAINFESAMKDVEKVVDADDAALARLESRLKSLSTQIPLTAGELAQIAAEGGRLGLAIDQLPDFVEQVAKMAVAFDLLPEEAGEAVAKLSNIFDIPIQDIERLGDAVNQLANNTAAKEKDIVEVLLRVGGSAKQFGLTAEQTAALADAMLALGRTPQIAGTAINALLVRLQAAEGQSKKFHEGLAMLETDAGSLADAIESDPQRALGNFLKTLEKLDKRTRSLVLTNLFGQEYADDIAILVGSLQEYEKALGLVADENEYLGGVQEEFNKRIEATEEKLQLLNDAATLIRINFSNALLPAINAIIPPLISMLNSISGLVEAHPEIVAVFAAFFAGAVAIRTIGLALKLVRVIFGGLLADTVVLSAKLPLLGRIFDAIGKNAGVATQQVVGLLTNLRALSALGAAGIAIAIAIKIRSDLEDATDRLRRYREFRDQANREASGLVKANREYADTQILAADAVGRLSRTELQSYRERLEAARNYYLGLARQDILLNKDGSLTELIVRNKATAQSYWDAIQTIEPAMQLREKQEELHGKKIAAIKRVVTEEIRDELAEQLRLEEKATKDLAKAQAGRLQIQKEFQQLITQLTSPAQKPVEDATVLDLNRLRDRIRTNIESGDFESALTNAKRAKAIIEALAAEEKATNSYLATQAKLVAELADEAAKGREGKAQDQANEARANIERLKAEAEALKTLDIGFNMEKAKEEAGNVVALIREQLANAELTVNVTPVLKEFQKDANKELGVEGFNRGGWPGGFLPGYGGGDRRLILAEDGEHITRKERASSFASLLNLINNGSSQQVDRLRRLLSGALPGYRAGGFVRLQPPSLPSLDSTAALAGSAAGGDTVYLSIGDDQVRLTASPDQTVELHRIVHLTRLKGGGR
ncbi:MAG: phage tail tape measure protein [Candidatus Thiodiazotropha sp. (ex Monitilora ramsayi)]|nr:phage tail tape measure protein [Candidatus Thiodiazotropha sp. (ex Monitilora ramsayi)]